jgi:hypothetical protein
MTLKNPDGTPYFAHTHNPLTATQEFPQDEVILHNFQWAKEGGTKPPVQKIEIVAEAPKIELPKPKPVDPPKPKAEEPKAINPNIKKVLIHCLLAGVVEKTNFYNEIIRSEGFTEKFTFEGVVVEESEMEIFIWTNAREITKGSIVYPSKYVGTDISYKSFNWWKVMETEQKTGGYLFRATLSPLQPDFS